MIRALVLILGLSLGLVLAALVGGTAAHLRLVEGWTGGALPGWMARLDADSRLTQGRGTWGEAVFSWRLIGLDGLAVSLTGPDWQAQGQALPGRDGLAIGQLSGVLPLAFLEAGPGMLALEGGMIALSPEGRLRAGQIDGIARGSDPEGSVRLTWDEGWKLAVR